MDRSRVCGAVGFFVCEMVCAMYTGRILVSIVVSIPACHAGDPGSIPGREAFVFRCSFAFALHSFFTFDSFVLAFDSFVLAFSLLTLLFALLSLFSFVMTS